MRFKLSKRLKDLSSKRIRIYGVFHTVPEEDRAAFAKEVSANLPPSTDPEKADFARSHELVTVLTSMDQFNQFATAYYLEQHRGHFENWCPIHGFESPSDPAAVDAYFSQCLADQYPDLGKDLTVVTWTYTASDIARVMRMFFGCMPVGAAYESEGDAAIENDYFAQNLARALEECLGSFTIEQAVQLMAGLCPKEVTDALFANPQDADDMEDQTAEQAPVEPPKGKRGRPRKNPGEGSNR